MFTVTTGASPDPCGPTITGFTPTCGLVGTVVTITGTNLLQFAGDSNTTPVTKPVGGTVQFNPIATATASHTGAAESPTTLVVNVPSGAKTGPIKVTTFAGTGGTVTSTTSFTVATDAAPCTAPAPFARSITLSLRKALVARGKVSASDATAPAGCTAAVPVKIQRRVSGHWKTVGSTTTSDTGAYKKRIRNRPGKYRSLAPKVTLASGDVCGRARSRVVRH